jgi:hypothetical protein
LKPFNFPQNKSTIMTKEIKNKIKELKAAHRESIKALVGEMQELKRKHGRPLKPCVKCGGLEFIKVGTAKRCVACPAPKRGRPKKEKVKIEEKKIADKQDQSVS